MAIRQGSWWKLGLLAVLLAGAWWFVRALGIDLTRLSAERIRQFVLSFGGLAPLAYLVSYGQPIVPLPASIMTVAAGLAFGPVWGTAAALGAGTVRACSAFLIARLLGRETVEKLLHGHVAKLDQTISRNGFQAVLLIRLIPNLPFDMQNYGLGFTKVTFSAFALATLLGMIPWSVALVVLGDSLADPAQVWKLWLSMAALIALALLAIVWRRRHVAVSVGGDPIMKRGS